jgi:hypothetical protein
MPFSRKPVRTAARLLLALLFITGATVSVSAATQHPALAITSCATPGPTTVRLSGEPSGEPTYNFTPHVTCTGLAAPVSERCQSKGYGTGGDQAVECVEIYVNTNHDGNFVEMWAEGFFSCQTAAGVYINCGFMTVATELGGVDHASGGSYSGFFNNPYVCSGNCPASGPADVASVHAKLLGTESATNDCAEVWAVATVQWGPDQLGGAEFTGDFSGPHVNICARDSIMSV